MATKAASAEVKCAKCGESCEPGSSRGWCKGCNAAYQREYERTKKEMTESRGYAAGVSAMRDYLIKNFDKYGSAGMFSGYEIADIIRRVKGPFDSPAVPTNGQPS
jgi:hypothetical protein